MQSQPGFREAIPVERPENSRRNMDDAKAACLRGLDQDLFVEMDGHPVGKLRRE